MDKKTKELIKSFNKELDRMTKKNNLTEIIEIAKYAKEIRKEWGYK
jgi:hypothetical protein